MHERYGRQTDRRTDGRTTYSERECEFTFAKNDLWWYINVYIIITSIVIICISFHFLFHLMSDNITCCRNIFNTYSGLITSMPSDRCTAVLTGPIFTITSTKMVQNCCNDASDSCGQLSKCFLQATWYNFKQQIGPHLICRIRIQVRIRFSGSVHSVCKPESGLENPANPVLMWIH